MRSSKISCANVPSFANSLSSSGNWSSSCALRVHVSHFSEPLALSLAWARSMSCTYTMAVLGAYTTALMGGAVYALRARDL